MARSPMIIPVWEPNLLSIPRIIPDKPKSASENVDPSNPRPPNTGIKNTGKKLISTPWQKAPIVAPRTPPDALPITPAVAPQKKWGTTPGRITTDPVKIIMTILTKPPTKLEIKPIRTAFGAYG